MGQPPSRVEIDVRIGISRGQDLPALGFFGRGQPAYQYEAEEVRESKEPEGAKGKGQPGWQAAGWPGLNKGFNPQGG